MTALYDFRCMKCGLVDSVNRKYLDTLGPPICVICGGRKLMKRVYSPPAIVWPKEKRGH